MLEENHLSSAAVEINVREHPAKEWLRVKLISTLIQAGYRLSETILHLAK